MRDFVSKKVRNIKPSGIRKFFDIASEIEGAISLGVGEPDFDTPWHIREEGIYSLEKGETYYTSNSGLKELRLEIAKYNNVDSVDVLYQKGVLRLPKDSISDGNLRNAGVLRIGTKNVVVAEHG